MIMVNSLDNPYYASEAKGASEKAQALGYKTTVLSHGEDVKSRMSLSTPRLVKSAGHYSR